MSVDKSMLLFTFNIERIYEPVYDLMIIEKNIGRSCKIDIVPGATVKKCPSL